MELFQHGHEKEIRIEKLTETKKEVHEFCNNYPIMVRLYFGTTMCVSACV